VGPQVETWSALADHLARASGRTARVEPESAATDACPRIEADGTVAEVLEGLRLGGWATWTLETGEPGGRGTLVVRVIRRQGDQTRKSPIRARRIT
jgi:hypothetical protein